MLEVAQRGALAGDREGASSVWVKRGPCCNGQVSMQERASAAEAAAVDFSSLAVLPLPLQHAIPAGRHGAEERTVVCAAEPSQLYFSCPLLPSSCKSK